MNSHSVGLRIAEANFAAVSSAFFLSSSDISSLSAPRSKRVTLDMIVSSIAAEESHSRINLAYSGGSSMSFKSAFCA